MANVMFKRGLLKNLPSTYKEGTTYYVTDERAIYFDVSDTQRIRMGDFQEFETIDALKANTNPSTSALYYVTGANCLAKWNGTDYIQINLDTGMTSVEVTGEGNAITGATYNASTRKLTLTKGETFAAREYIGEIPDGYTETNIVAYINKKAEETLSSASGGSTESAASVLAALNTYKSETNPRLEALEAVDHEHTNKAELDLIESGDKAKWDAVVQKVGELPADKTVVQMIADAKTDATYDDTQVKADIKANADAIALLNDASTVEGSVDYKIAQAVAAIMENPDDTMNSINELVTWCNDHASDALELSNQVSTNKDDIAALEALVGEDDVATQIADAIAATMKTDGADKYALAADLTAAIARIVSLEAKAHEHANATELNKIADGDVAKWNAAQANAEATAAAALSEAKTELEGKITAENERAVEAEAQALTDAKAYADSLVLTWGTF